MFNDHESTDSPRSLLDAAVAAARDQLDRLVLANGAFQHLTRHILINHREATGVDAAAERIARRLVDERAANAREAIDRLARLVAPERESEAAASLSKFSQEAVEALSLGNLADADRLLTAFGYTINRLSAPSVVPTVPRNVNDLPDEVRRQLVAAGWSVVETEFLTLELMYSGEALAGFDARGAITSAGRTVTRQTLREKSAPLHPTYREKFLNSLPPLPSER